jgi:small subunit ribosomal protein SAe
MKPYVFSRRTDGIHVLHIGKTWEKLMLAARVLAITEPEGIFVAFSAVKSRRAAIKLAQYLGANINKDRFVPGTFTNSLVEPTLLVCMDPLTDYQAVAESSRCTMPVIAFTNSHSPLKYVDIAIPCNNVGVQSIGVMCWLLARAVLRLRGVLNYIDDWDVLPDMFFYSEELMAEGEIGYCGNQSYTLEVRLDCSDLYEDQQSSVDGGDWTSDDFGMQEIDTMSQSLDPAEGKVTTGGSSNSWDGSCQIIEDTIKFQFEGITSSWSEQSVRQSIPSSFGFGQQDQQLSAPIDWAEDIPDVKEKEGHPLSVEG